MNRKTLKKGAVTYCSFTSPCNKDKEISINDSTHVNNIGGKVRTVTL